MIQVEAAHLDTTQALSRYIPDAKWCWQSLGMIGSKTLPPLIDMLLTTDDMTVR
jgi:hypothetical protein